MKTVVNLSAATAKYFDDEIFDSFVREVSNFPAGLSREQEAELFKLAECGDMDARNKIWEANQRFVVKTAKLYANATNINDLIQVGNIGLYQAIEKFDWRTGNKFISLAAWYIRREIVHYLIADSQPIKKSNGSKTALKVKKIKEEFFKREHRYPEIVEIQNILEEQYSITIKDRADLFDIVYDSVNMNFDDDDEYTFENSQFFNDRTASINEYERESEDDYRKMVVDKLLSTFKDRERKIIEMTFGLGKYEGKEYKSAEIADELNLTKERVRQIKKSAIEKMHRICKQYGIKAA